MSNLLNYIPSRHDIFEYDTVGGTQTPTGFNPDFYLLSYKPYFSCLNVTSRSETVPNSNGPSRATLISPIHIIGSKDNVFDVGSEFLFYSHKDFTSFTRTVISKTTVGDSIILGELDEAVESDGLMPTRFVLSNDGDIDNNMVGETLVIIDQDNRVGIREVSSVDSDNIYHAEGPSNLLSGYLPDDKILQFYPGDEGCPVFYSDLQGRMVLIGFVNETGVYVEFISRHVAEINDILDSYGYSLRHVNPFEDDTEITPDVPEIRIQKRVYWHMATTSNPATQPSPDIYDPEQDPVEQSGISTLVTHGGGSVSANFLSGSIYAIDRLCLFPQNVSIPVYSGNYDISPGYFIFQLDSDKLEKVFQYKDFPGTPKTIQTSEDILDPNNYCVLNYMLFGAYNKAADSCGKSDSPDEWFDSDGNFSDSDTTLDDIAKTSLDKTNLVSAMKPYKDIFSDGSDAGFYFKMQDIEDIEKVGCCDVIAGGDECDERPYPGSPDKFTRIWMVRQWVNTWFDTRRNSEDYPPLASELVYADLDESYETPKWVHAGFITFEDQAPYVYNGFNIPDGFNGNLKDVSSGFNIDIQDISWDDQGRLWALCSGGFDDSGVVDLDDYVDASGITTVEGIYQLLPGGKSKRTLADDTEVDIFFPARLLRREEIRHTYNNAIDTPYVWVAKPTNDAYFEGDAYAESIDGDGQGYIFSDISTLIVDNAQTVDGYEFAKMPLFVFKDRILRVMEWHWRPYKDREPKYRVKHDLSDNFDNYDRTSLDLQFFSCYSNGTLTGARPRRFRNFVDSSGILQSGTNIANEEIFNEIGNQSALDVSFVATETETGVRGIYTYEAPFVSEYIKYSDATNNSDELFWSQYINDNFMQFNFIDSHYESKRFRLRTNWSSMLWRRRETLPREFIIEGSGSSISFPSDHSHSIDPQVSGSICDDSECDHMSGWSVAMDGNLVVVGERFGSYHTSDEFTHPEENRRQNGAVTTWVVDDEGAMSWYEDRNNRIGSSSPGGNTLNYGKPASDVFGYSVGVTKSSTWSYGFGVMIVGSPGWKDEGTGDSLGRAYLYKLNSSGNWVNETIFHNVEDIVAQNNNFGSSVDVDGDIAVIGHSMWSGGKGRVYILQYDSASESWENTASLDGTTDSGFGEKVSVSGNTIAISSGSGGANGVGEIAIYRYDSVLGVWTPDDIALETYADNSFIGRQSLRINGSSLFFSRYIYDTGITGGVEIYEYDDSSPSWKYIETKVDDFLSVDSQFGAGNNNIYIDNDLAVIGSARPENGVYDRRVYVYKKNFDNSWSRIDSFTKNVPVDDLVESFGYSVAVSSTEQLVIVGDPTYNSEAENDSDEGIVYSWKSTDSESSRDSYTHDFAGDTSRGKALYPYMGLHNSDAPPFINYFEQDESYISFWIDDMGAIDSTNAGSFADNSQVAQFNLEIRKYWSHDDNLVTIIESTYDEFGNPNAGVYKISDFNVIPFKNITTNNGSSEEYADRGFFIVTVYYDADPIDSDIFGTKVGQYVTTLTRIFHYPNRTDLEDTAGWDSPDAITQGSGDLRSFAITRPVYQRSVNNPYGPYRKTGCASGGVFISSFNWSDEDDNDEDDNNIKIINADYPNISVDPTKVNQRSNRLIFYPKIGYYYSISGSTQLEDHESEWLEITRVVNMPMYMGSDLAGYVYREFDGFTTSPVKENVWCTSEVAGAEELPWSASVMEDRPLHISTRSLTLQIICTNNIGDMGRCRFRLEWSSEGDDSDPDSINYPSAIFALSNNGAYRCDGSYVPSIEGGWSETAVKSDYFWTDISSVLSDSCTSTSILAEESVYSSWTQPHPCLVGGGDGNENIAVTCNGFQGVVFENLYYPGDTIANQHAMWQTNDAMYINFESSADFEIQIEELILSDHSTTSSGGTVKVSSETTVLYEDDTVVINDGSWLHLQNTLGHFNGNIWSSKVTIELSCGYNRYFFLNAVKINIRPVGTDGANIYKTHYLPAKEKIFVDSRFNNKPFFMTSATHTDRSLLPRFKYNVFGYDSDPGSSDDSWDGCSNSVANRILAFTYNGSAISDLAGGGVSHIPGSPEPYLFSTKDILDGVALEDANKSGTLGSPFSIYACHYGNKLKIAYSFMSGRTTSAPYTIFNNDPWVSGYSNLYYSSVNIIETETYAPNKILDNTIGGQNILGHIGSNISSMVNYDDESSDEWAYLYSFKTLMGQNLNASDDFKSLFISFARNTQVDVTDAIWDTHPPFIEVFADNEDTSWSSLGTISKNDTSYNVTDMGLSDIRLYPNSLGGSYLIVDVDESTTDTINDSEILFQVTLSSSGEGDIFTECNTFTDDAIELGYDNAFSNANAWVASPMTARNGSQSMVFNPNHRKMYIRSGNAFFVLQSKPESLDGNPLSSIKNVWSLDSVSKMFDLETNQFSYPVKSFSFHKNSYDPELAYNGNNCNDNSCESIFHEISAFSAPTTILGNNYNMCRFMVYKFSGNESDGLYQFDGVNSRQIDLTMPAYAFPTIEHDIDLTNPQSPSFIKNVPISYSEAGQMQYSVLNEGASSRATEGGGPTDTRYDPPLVVFLKTTDIETGESFYVDLDPSDPSIDSYSPYLLIRYPVYQISTFSQGIGGEEINRSFAFCSAENQMQLAFDRVSNAHNAVDGYIYKYGIGGNYGTQHGTFMQLDWHDTAGGGFLDNAPFGQTDKMYLVQDIVRDPTSLEDKDNNTSGGQLISIDFSDGSNYSPEILYQNIFDESSQIFSGEYPKLDKNAITVGCHTPSAMTPDFTFPYRAPFFLMNYYSDNNMNYQPMGFFVDNMTDGGTLYRRYTTHTASLDNIIDLYDPYDPYDHILEDYEFRNNENRNSSNVDISRLDRCKEIISDLFDQNHGQVYCNDYITITSLDFIQGTPPTCYPDIYDNSGVINDKKIENKEDLKAAVGFISQLPSSLVNIGDFFYNLDCGNADAMFNTWVSPYKPYRSMIFMITSNDERFSVNGDSVTVSNIQNIINSLRSKSILHINGSIHIVDLVPRDKDSILRVGLTRLAEISGGYYTVLRGDQQ